MKNMHAFILLSLVAGASSCNLLRNAGGSKDSRVLQLDKQDSQDISSVAGTPGALCQHLLSNNYYPSNVIPPGSPVAFSTSYNVDKQNSHDAEEGQANGVVTSDGMFQQQDNVTTQLLFCPGAMGGLNGGKCLWKLSGDDGYAELAFRVVCNRAANYGSPGPLHPGYTAMKVSHVSFTASTAGKSFSYPDAIEVELTGGQSKADIYFAKNVGFVATEFREDSMPGGTAKVYIGARGTSLTGGN